MRWLAILLLTVITVGCKDEMTAPQQAKAIAECHKYGLEAWDYDDMTSTYSYGVTEIHCHPKGP